jgi:oligopeptide/dipeptide ABC transporter ATP-binding protein
MYLGKVVELAETETLFTRPKHPYTEALMSAISIPDPRLRDKRKHIVLKGEIPSPRNPPSGCHFHPRCRYAEARCAQEAPALTPIGDTGHLTACFFPELVSGGVPLPS